MRGPYCAGAVTPSGKTAFVCVPQREQRHVWARCSVTNRGVGSGRSNTCLAACSVAMVSFRGLPQPVQLSGKWLRVVSGVAVRRSVLPGWPGCPPVFLPDFSRKLQMRVGFFRPSLDGGLPLLPLFRPRRRSSSAMRACSAAIAAACRASCARSSVMRSSFESCLRAA